MPSRTDVDGERVSAPSPLAPGLTNVSWSGQHPGGMARSRIVAGHRIGALEAEVLGHLWDATAPLSVRDIMSKLKGRRRAYTTVMTVLTRLHEKGLVERVLSGRAYLYRASGTPAEIEARRIQDLLAASEDPKAVLAHFVEDLAKDPELLRSLDRARKRRGTR